MQQCIKLQASHRFLDSYESLIATKKEADDCRGRHRERKERDMLKTERQGQYNERRDSRSAHDDGLEETLLCTSLLISQ